MSSAHTHKQSWQTSADIELFISYMYIIHTVYLYNYRHVCTRKCRCLTQIHHFANSHKTMYAVCQRKSSVYRCLKRIETTRKAHQCVHVHYVYSSKAASITHTVTLYLLTSMVGYNATLCSCLCDATIPFSAHGCDGRPGVLQWVEHFARAQVVVTVVTADRVQLA